MKYFESFESFESNNDIFSYFYNNLCKSYYDRSIPAQSDFPNMKIIQSDFLNKDIQLKITNNQINYFQLLRLL